MVTNQMASRSSFPQCKLIGVEDTSSEVGGCIGSGVVQPWQLADTASERPWLTKMTESALSSASLDPKCKALKDLSLYACDIERLTDVRNELQRSGRVTIVSGDIKEAASRRRSVALEVCTALLHERQYKHLLRVSSASASWAAARGQA